LAPPSRGGRRQEAGGGLLARKNKKTINSITFPGKAVKPPARPYRIAGITGNSSLTTWKTVPRKTHHRLAPVVGNEIAYTDDKPGRMEGTKSEAQMWAETGIALKKEKRIKSGGNKFSTKKRLSQLKDMTRRPRPIRVIGSSDKAHTVDA
jgi:hypothetical protein